MNKQPRSCDSRAPSAAPLPICAYVMLAALPATAATPWPNAAKVAYTDRCASSMISQGLPDQYARPYCSCIADGMEREFGTEEYEQMMQAQPSPEGSPYDKRLYGVLAACGDLLPK